MKKTRSREAAELVGPLAVAAAISAAADRLSPMAHSAADRLAPFAQQAADAMGPYAQQAAERLTPLATSVRERGAEVLHDAGERFGPRLDGARDRVGPAVEAAVEAARDKVSEELMPKLTEVLAAAAASPLAVEAISRGKATLAAATGELTLPPEKPKRRWPQRLAVVAALSGLGYVVARKLLGSKDSEWQTARPTTPYAPPQPSAPAAPATAAAPAAEEAVSDVNDVPTAEHDAPGDDPQAGASAHAEYLEANGDAEPDQPAEGGVEDSFVAESGSTPVTDEAPAYADELATEDFATDGVPDGFVAEESLADEFVAGDFVADDFVAADVPTTETPSIGDDVTGIVTDPEAELVYVTETEVSGDGGEPAAQRWSGEGVYVGAEPPEGYTIKGNQRSMKYHVPESGGYARTIAEVWFNSTEAAESAGFVRAQR